MYQNNLLFEKFGFKSSSLRGDTLALTTSFGINFLNTKALHSFHGSDSKQIVDVSGRYYAILLLQGKYYVGNQDGLFCGTKNNNDLTAICLDDLLESVGVNGIKMSTDSLVWVSTDGNGVYVLKNDIVINHFSDQLLDANIHSMKIDDKNRVWIATRKGVNLIRTQNQQFHVTGYNSYHGLPDNYINDVYSFDDTLYVATDNGLARCNIIDLLENKLDFVPKVHIVGFKFLKNAWQNFDLSANHHLKYDENNINIEFTGISFRSNSKIKFVYRLLPIVNDWIETNNDNITFNNLKAGNYTFEVKAIDALKHLSIKPAQVTFVVGKHYSDEIWFKIFVWGTIIAGISFAIWKYVRDRRATLAESRRIEKLISELKLQSLQAQLNPHFIFNSLNAIQQFINIENKKAANDYLSKFAKLMRLYLNGSDTQFISMAQELEVIKLYTSLEHLRFADKFAYSITIDDNINLDHYNVPAMLLQPHVENAIRHGLVPSGKNDNHFYISMINKTNGILCVIEDNGIGRTKSLELKNSKINEHRSMGNKISKERLEVIRSLKLGFITETIIDLTDSMGEICGTRVEIFITPNAD